MQAPGPPVIPANRVANGVDLPSIGKLGNATSLALMSAIKRLDAVEHPDSSQAVGGEGAGWERSDRRRLIKLLCAGSAFRVFVSDNWLGERRHGRRRGRGSGSD